MASKFDYDAFTDFYDGHTLLAVNQLENNLQKAATIAARELGTDELVASTGYVRYGFYTNEDGERCNGWVLELEKPKKGCPVWVFERKEDKYDGKVD